MKKVLTAAVIFASIPLGALAQDTMASKGAYLGAGFGRSMVTIDNIDGLSQSEKPSNGSMVSIFGGFRMTPYVGLELGYADLGKTHASYTDGSAVAYIDAKAQSVYAAVTGTLPLGQGFSLLGKLGVDRNHATANAFANLGGFGASSSASGNRSSVYLAAGVGYDITPQFGVSAMYQNFGKVADDVKVQTVGVQVVYRF